MEIAWVETIPYVAAGVGAVLGAVAIHLLESPKRKVKVNLPPPDMTEQAHDKYNVTIAEPRGLAQFWQISDPVKKGVKPYAWAFIVSDPVAAECFLWMVYVRENVRRQGYGRDMLRILQEKFKKITTHYDRGIVSKPGVKLCMACGFRMKPALYKRDASELVWERARA